MKTTQTDENGCHLVAQMVEHTLRSLDKIPRISICQAIDEEHSSPVSDEEDMFYAKLLDKNGSMTIYFNFTK